MVDDYVLGFCIRDGAVRTMLHEEGTSKSEALESLLDYVEGTASAAEASRTPARSSAKATCARTGSALAAEAFDPERFERGLTRLLDGIELDLGRR